MIFRPVILIISSLLIFINTFRTDKTSRMYFNEGFDFGQVQEIEKKVVQFKDTLTDDTLHLCFNKGLPLAVFRNITTGVCLDGECRVITIRLYWTITGRYLGYSLPAGQQLTKKEHIAFTGSEYLLLHSVLSDSLSILANYSLQDIQPAGLKNIRTDGISGATAPDLTGYIVPGAAYTSCTLWHLVYGSTRDSIVALLQNRSTALLLDSLLKKPDVYDKRWALDVLQKKGINDQHFIYQVISMIPEVNYPLVKHCLSYLEKKLPDSLLQPEIVRLFMNKDPDLQSLARDYFKNHILYPGVADYVIRLLQSELINQREMLFTVLENYSPSRKQLGSISVLLECSDKELAWRAFSYMRTLGDQDKTIHRKMKQFERKHNF